jgi:hypothetical protein
MIYVSPSEQLIAFLSLGLSLIIFGWLLSATRRKRQVARRQFLITCRICGVCYEVPDNISVRLCPSCETPNEVTSDDSI